MHKHGFEGPKGTVHRFEHTSKILESNPWQDPVTRQLDVYVPPGHDGKNLPLLVDLTGYMGAGPVHSAFKPIGENVPERCDRLLQEGQMQPCVVAFPDCFTRLAGNQYVNSAALGNYADYLIEEIVPFVENLFGCGGSRDKRGCFGKSSGGYGSVYHAMAHNDTWAAAACHSGDMGFEYVYRSLFPEWLNMLNEYGGDVQAMIEAFWNNPKPPTKLGHAMLMTGMAASYDPDPQNPRQIRLPFTDLKTGEVDEEAWQRWLPFDPVVMVDDRHECLKNMKLLYIDCGSKDQYHIHYGSRQLAKKLEHYGIEHSYEEFDDDHSKVDYRMDISLPRLSQALSA